MQVKKKGQEGFTLIELLVVVVIIGILASVAVPNFMGAQDKAKNSGVQSNVHSVQMALEQYAVDYSGQYPKVAAAAEAFSVGDMSTVISEGYLAAYPRTPWNTQQAAESNIAASADNIALNKEINASGTMAAPTADTHFGAVGYSVGGPANEKYVMTGTGKRGNAAILSIRVKNH